MLPELKNRTLEELDLMFEMRIPARSFAKYDISDLVAERKEAHGAGVESVVLKRLGGSEGEMEEVEEKKV